MGAECGGERRSSRVFIACFHNTHLTQLCLCNSTRTNVRSKLHMGPLCSENMAEKSDRMLFVGKKRTQDKLCLNPIGTLTNTSSPPSTLLIAVSCSGSIDLYPKASMPLSIDCERRVGLTLSEKHVNVCYWILLSFPVQDDCSY